MIFAFKTCWLHIFNPARAEIPEGNHGSNVVVNIPVPRACIGYFSQFLDNEYSLIHLLCRCSFETSVALPGSGAEFIQSDRKIVWSIKKFVGGSEISLRCKLTLDQPVTASHRREIGPIAMNFEIPMYNVSNLQVRYLRISETHKSYNPYRWVRYVTLSSSYVSRV